MITPRPHYERWIDGRKNKNGEISNPNTKLVVEKINKLKEAQKSGEFTSEGSHDILSEALGTPEHGGYVRGIGGKSTLSSYFKRKKRSCQNEGTMTFKQVEKFSIQLTEQVRQQTREEMKDLTLELLKSCGTKILTNMQMTIIDENTRSSFQLANPDPFANGCKDPKPCEMTILDENIGHRVVAKGTLLWSEPGELIHTNPLRSDHVKVKILQVIHGEEKRHYPYLFSGMKYLGTRRWAQWSRKQVRLVQEEYNSPQPKNKKQDE